MLYAGCVYVRLYMYVVRERCETRSAAPAGQIIVRGIKNVLGHGSLVY